MHLYCTTALDETKVSRYGFMKLHWPELENRRATSTCRAGRTVDINCSLYIYVYIYKFVLCTIRPGKLPKCIHIRGKFLLISDYKIP